MVLWIFPRVLKDHEFWFSEVLKLGSCNRTSSCCIENCEINFCKCCEKVYCNDCNKVVWCQGCYQDTSCKACDDLKSWWVFLCYYLPTRYKVWNCLIKSLCNPFDFVYSAKCLDRLCLDCASWVTCQECGELICAECSTTCDYCRKSFCEGCDVCSYCQGPGCMASENTQKVSCGDCNMIKYW